MKRDELEALLEDVLPNGFKITLDRKGQVVVHTGLFEDDDGDLVDSLEVHADDDESEDEDLDIDSLDDDEEMEDD